MEMHIVLYDGDSYDVNSVDLFCEHNTQRVRRKLPWRSDFAMSPVLGDTSLSTGGRESSLSLPGNLNFLEPSGPLQACNGTAVPFTAHLDIMV